MDIRGKGVNFDRVREIALSVSGNQYGGNLIVHPDAKPLGANGYGFRGRVIANASRVNGSRSSWSGRATRAACWHAYRDVLRAVFAEYPHAVVTTALARYEGAAGFESTYASTAYKNIGSMAAPAFMPDLCDGLCAGSER